MSKIRILIKTSYKWLKTILIFKIRKLDTFIRLFLGRFLFFDNF